MAYEKKIKKILKKGNLKTIKVPESFREAARKKQEGLMLEVSLMPAGKPRPKKNKKLIFGCLAAIVIIGAGVGVYFYNDQQQKQKILDSIQVMFVDDPVIEYGEKDFDLNTLIKDKTDEIVKHSELDTTKLGKQTVVYRVEKESLTKEFTLEAEVKDTKGPEIIFKEDTVSLEYGAEFDLKSNIESVKDPVDGDVPYGETAGENNYFIVEGSVDASTAGEYTITVKAKDKNGIESEKAFIVTIAEEYIEPQAPASTGSGNNQSTYQQPASSSGYTAPSGANYSGGGSNPTPAPTCDSNAYKDSTDAILVGKYGLFPNNTVCRKDMDVKGETGSIIPIFNQCGDVMGYTKAIKGVDF